MTNPPLILIGLFVGQLVITGYRSEARFTDDSPYITSTGEHVTPDGVAVSQDLLFKNGGPIRYGDWLYIDGVGLKKANDCMNHRYKNRIDIWCASKEEEAKIWQRFKNKKTRVWIIHKTIKGD